MSRSVQQILDEADELLQTAEFGYEDMSSTRGRGKAGLRNAVVFGRNCTWALQNLKGKAPGFEEWYAEKQKEMGSDPLMVYFRDLRTKIEKQASTPTGFRGFNIAITSEGLRQIKKPPNTVETVMWDDTGASYHLVRGSSGREEKYYFDLPNDFGDVYMNLPEAPGAEKFTASELVRLYLDKLGNILSEAQNKFGNKRERPDFYRDI